MMKTLYLVMIIILTFSCQPESKSVDHSPTQEKTLKLAVTTSTVNSGLLDVLIPVFERQSGLTVEVTAKGSGAALSMGRKGNVDLVLVHARDKEDEFVQQGHGINRRNVMYNEFVIVGPSTDPAQIKGNESSLASLERIFSTSSRFLSRGDSSGTHQSEKSLWKTVNLQPSGQWYSAANKGMLDTLMLASNQKAYTLTDLGTFLFNRDQINLEILVRGDPLLHNPYGVIAVNPGQHLAVNYKGAMQFIEFLTSFRGQEIISSYGTMQFGQPLFTPSAK